MKLTYKTVVVLCIAIFSIELILREAGVQHQLRPSYWIEKGGNVVEESYYFLGIVGGEVYYLLCLFGRFVHEKLWRAFTDTLFDLGKACLPYFNLSKFVEGAKYIALEFWSNYYHLIVPGWAALVVILISIFLIVPNKYKDNLRKYIQMIELFPPEVMNSMEYKKD